jgi:deazaflavin-dependent oxidoreductase (nitroreductase family)
MRRPLIVLLGAVTAVIAGLAIYWRWFPRAGLKWTNEVGNPWLVERGWSGSGTSEIGTLEHVGRKSGTRHLTPVHPVPTPDGFRIVVPLAEKSEWAKNVLAAGHCRLQLRDTIYELDEPLLVKPVDVREAPTIVRRIAQMLGWEYLRLHTFAEAPGMLEPIAAVAREPKVEPEPKAEPGPEAAESPEAVPAG